jgi:cytochrome c-type biogenesis protein
MAPLTAVCVIPLYPGYLSFLSNKLNKKVKAIHLGLLVSLGVIVSMFLVGLVFTTIFSSSLTNAIGIISPIAFVILGVISVLLIFNYDIGHVFPKVKLPKAKRGFLGSFMYGLLFGVIILPCNPGALVVLFALSTSIASFILNLINFVLFGVGMALPLLLLSYLADLKNRSVVNFLVRYKRMISIISGVLMLGISIYYLFFVFEVYKIFI